MPATSSLKLVVAAISALAALPAEAQTIKVAIEKLEFHPAVVTATVGDRIEWMNTDVMAHTATVKDGFDVVIPPHASAGIEITKTGQFSYFCRFHPNMRGSIDVPAK